MTSIKHAYNSRKTHNLRKFNMSEPECTDTAPSNIHMARNGASRNLTEGAVSKHLLRLSIPMVWGIFSIIAIQLIDMFYIGLLGEQALAAISFTFPVTYAVFSVFMGFGVAMSSVVSRLIGAGEHTKMHRVLFHGFILVALCGTICAVLGNFYARDIFALMGAEGAVLDDLLGYMHIWFAGVVLVSLPMIGNSAMRACGDARIPAYVMGVSALTNLIMDPILIFGWLGFPEMGMEGAALATILSYFAGLVIGLYIMIFKMKILVNPAEFGWLKDFGDSTRRLVVIAVPAGITSAIQPLLQAFVTALLAGSGAYAVAAYGVVTRVEAFLFVPIMAMSTGLAPIIGQNFGAGLYGRVYEGLHFWMRLAFIWSLLTAVLMMALGGFITSWFSDNAQTIKLAQLYFWIVPVTSILANILPGWASAFNAVAKPHLAFFILIFRMLVLSAPACLVGAHLAGVTGIFLGLAVANILSGTLTHVLGWRYISRYA